VPVVSAYQIFSTGWITWRCNIKNQEGLPNLIDLEKENQENRRRPIYVTKRSGTLVRKTNKRREEWGEVAVVNQHNRTRRRWGFIPENRTDTC